MRGKCKEYSLTLAKECYWLRPVRGFYYCWVWDKKEQHWWNETDSGEIIDLTVSQFPSGKMGQYQEYLGEIECCECGKVVPEVEARIEGSYATCSTLCMMRLVGLARYV